MTTPEVVGSLDQFPRQVVAPVGEVAQQQELASLCEINEVLDQEAKARLAHKIAEARATDLPTPDDYLAVRLRGQINAAVAAVDGLAPEVASIAPPRPGDNTLTQGIDLAVNVRALHAADDGNRSEHGAYDAIGAAREVAEKLPTGGVIGQVEVVDSFVNVTIDYGAAAPEIIGEVVRYGNAYGHSRTGDPEVVVVDSSSPNVGKLLTEAHLKSTVQGQAIGEAIRAAGDVDFRANYLGDWGMTFGKLISQYRHELAERGDEFLTELQADPAATLLKIYRKYHNEVNEHPERAAEADEIVARLEAEDPEVIALWAQFKEWSVADFGPIYDAVGAKYDSMQGESFCDARRMEAIIQEGLDSGVLERTADGSIVLRAEVDGQPRALVDPTTGKQHDRIMCDVDGNPKDEVIVKGDGTTTYLARDLAALAYRVRELGADEVLYVVGKEQKPHFLKLFAIAEAMGLVSLDGGNGSARCRVEHTWMGHKQTYGRKMSSRGGKVTMLGELLDDSSDAARGMLVRRARDMGIAEEDIDQDWLAATARQIGVGALVYRDLTNKRTKDIEADPDGNVADAIWTSGALGVQDTFARLSGALEGIERFVAPEDMRVPDTVSQEERALLANMAQLPLVITKCARTHMPHEITDYLSTLSRSVDAYCNTLSIGADGKRTGEETEFQLALMSAARQVMGNTAKLLHLNLPERTYPQRVDDARPVVRRWHGSRKTTGGDTASLAADPSRVLMRFDRNVFAARLGHLREATGDYGGRLATAMAGALRLDAPERQLVVPELHESQQTAIDRLVAQIGGTGVREVVIEASHVYAHWDLDAGRVADLQAEAQVGAALAHRLEAAGMVARSVLFVDNYNSHPARGGTGDRLKVDDVLGVVGEVGYQPEMVLFEADMAGGALAMIAHMRQQGLVKIIDGKVYLNYRRVELHAPGEGAADKVSCAGLDTFFTTVKLTQLGQAAVNILPSGYGSQQRKVRHILGDHLGTRVIPAFNIFVGPQPTGDAPRHLGIGVHNSFRKPPRQRQSVGV